jgi:hypothetical protein
MGERLAGKVAEVTGSTSGTGHTIDVARAALFAASEDASFIAGHALMVDGGLTIQLQDPLMEHMLAELPEEPAVAASALDEP